MNKRMCTETKMCTSGKTNRPRMCWCSGNWGNEYSGMALGYLTSSWTSQQLEHFHCPCLSHGLEGQHSRTIFPWCVQIPITSAEPGSSTYLDAEFLRFYTDDNRAIVSWNFLKKNAALMNLQNFNIRSETRDIATRGHCQAAASQSCCFKQTKELPNSMWVLVLNGWRKKGWAFASSSI